MLRMPARALRRTSTLGPVCLGVDAACVAPLALHSCAMRVPFLAAYLAKVYATNTWLRHSWFGLRAALISLAFSLANTQGITAWAGTCLLVPVFGLPIVRQVNRLLPATPGYLEQRSDSAVVQLAAELQASIDEHADRPADQLLGTNRRPELASLLRLVADLVEAAHAFAPPGWSPRWGAREATSDPGSRRGSRHHVHSTPRWRYRHPEMCVEVATLLPWT